MGLDTVQDLERFFELARGRGKTHVALSRGGYAAFATRGGDLLEEASMVLNSKGPASRVLDVNQSAVGQFTNCEL